MSQKRILPHVRQSDSGRNCGAACLKMVCKYYKIGKKLSLKDFTKNVSITLPGGMLSCRNNLMLSYARDLGFHCYVVTVKDAQKTITACLDKNVEVIINYHPYEFSDCGHFSWVSYADDKFVYLNDPAKDLPSGQNYPIEWERLKQRMIAGSPLSEFPRNNTMLILYLPNQEISLSEEHQFPEFLVDETIATLNPDDTWRPIH